MKCLAAVLASLLLAAALAIGVWAEEVLEWVKPYIQFAPATGPVAYYELRVRNLEGADVGLSALTDQRFLSSTSEPIVEIPASFLPPEPRWIDARACNEVGTVRACGAWSPLHWNTQDRIGPDGVPDGIVNAADLIACSQTWGELCNATDVVEMSQHWLDRTVEAVPGTGLRIYK